MPLQLNLGDIFKGDGHGQPLRECHCEEALLKLIAAEAAHSKTRACLPLWVARGWER